MSDLAGLFQSALALGGSASVGALITGLFGRKRGRVDSSAVLSEASAHFVEETQKDLDTARVQIRQYHERVIAHQRWDALVIRKLDKAGEDYPDPPTLYL